MTRLALGGVGGLAISFAATLCGLRLGVIPADGAVIGSALAGLGVLVGVFVAGLTGGGDEPLGRS